MRKSIIIICIAILAFCLWLLLHREIEPVKNALPEAQVSLTNQHAVEQPAPINGLGESKIMGVSNPAPIPPPRRSGIEISNAILQQMQADWQKPIDFYGKVIDENSNPVVSANIQFRWSGLSDKVFKAATESDVEGLFSLHGKQGRVLDVLVSKEGYYGSRNDKTGFLF